ncbi:hypothetical protein TIFTF001_026510 [Ficus carica]|uniref:Uncharacterized protein n=1 Tax=Ficus carica TaxID=3494 RepID=A0AA88DLZ0_FICCA|nr:hypothetical protein TIFTF001_026510 [Ficus carica]
MVSLIPLTLAMLIFFSFLVITAAGRSPAELRGNDKEGQTPDPSPDDVEDSFFSSATTPDVEIEIEAETPADQYGGSQQLDSSHPLPQTHREEYSIEFNYTGTTSRLRGARNHGESSLTEEYPRFPPSEKKKGISKSTTSPSVLAKRKSNLCSSSAASFSASASSSSSSSIGGIDAPAASDRNITTLQNSDQLNPNNSQIQAVQGNFRGQVHNSLDILSIVFRNREAVNQTQRQTIVPLLVIGSCLRDIGHALRIPWFAKLTLCLETAAFYMLASILIPTSWVPLICLLLTVIFVLLGEMRK